jgi:hypothetical protein
LVERRRQVRPSASPAHPADVRTFFRADYANLGLAETADAAQDHILRQSLADVSVPAGDDETGGEAFDAPIPGGGDGFFEVVDGEEDSVLVGAKPPKLLR